MAVDMFIKIKDITGEAKDDSHKDEIDVLAWSWGMSQSGSMHVGGGGGSGKVSVQDLSFTKYVDAASPHLIAKCCDGTHISEIILTVRKAGGTAVEYIILTLTDSIISSVSTGGSGGEDRLTENVTINFAKFNFKYTPQDKAGKGGTPIPTGWDIEKNIKA